VKHNLGSLDPTWYMTRDARKRISHIIRHVFHQAPDRFPGRPAPRVLCARALGLAAAYDSSGSGRPESACVHVRIVHALHACIYLYISVYYIYLCVYICVYIYIYIYLCIYLCTIVDMISSVDITIEITLAKSDGLMSSHRVYMHVYMLLNVIKCICLGCTYT
jgi:hypothetical protein